MNLDIASIGQDLREITGYLCNQCNESMVHLNRNKYICPKCSTLFKEKIVF